MRKILAIMLLLLFLPNTGASAADDRPIRVFVKGVLNLSIVQQNGDSNYVPSDHGLASQFQDASEYGTIGLLAHDYLSGKLFYKLRPGARVILYYQNGFELWRITKTLVYYPSPDLTPEMMFVRIYTNGGLVFQTCLDGGGYFFAIGRLDRVIEHRK